MKFDLYFAYQKLNSYIYLWIR